MTRVVELFQRFDWTLLVAVAALTSIGLVAIYGIGVSQEPASLFTFYKQMTAAALGLGCVGALVLVDYRHLRAFSLLLYVLGALLLLGVLFFGQEVRATQGWYRIGSLSFQPVELAKLTLVGYLAAFFAGRAHGNLSWRAFLQSGLAAGVYAFLVLLQPDFGSAMVLLLIWGAMALFAGLPRRAWLILPIVALVLGGVVWEVGLKPYQRDRLMAFANPELDPRGSGYNARQARIAIGSGGWFGKGIAEGSQARLRFLPEAATDFIFSVVGEELGFVGVAIVLGLFLYILYRMLRLGYESEDDFAALLLIGLAAVFLVHLIVNAGMNLGVMPVTGIPMPFLSAAASSLMVAYVGIGVAESVAARRRGNPLGIEAGENILSTS